MQAVFLITVGAMCLATGFSMPRKPQRCQAPHLYTGRLTMGTQNEQWWIVTKYYYDAFNQRIHVEEEGTFNNASFTYNALLLYQEGLMYEIYHHNKTCVKKALQSDFHTMEVPKGAVFVNQVVLGTSSSPGQGLLVNSWLGDMPDRQDNMVSFTEFGCLPVSAFFKYKNMGWVSLSYYDNVLGVEDPNVFIPPPFCMDAKMEANEDGKVSDFFSLFH